MQALGLIETKGLVPAIISSDAMLKASDVNLLERTYVGGGLVSITVTGDVAAVKAAVEAGSAAVKTMNSQLLVSQHVIPRPHEELENTVVSAVPLKDIDIDSDKIQIGKDERAETVNEISTKVEETEVKSTKDIANKAEKIDTSIKIDLNKLHDKNYVDKIVLKNGLEKAMKALGELKVVELRSLARKYEKFGIKGKEIANAGKDLLMKEFKQYYRDN